MSKDSTKIIGIILGVCIGIIGAFLYFDPKMQNNYAQVENLSENNVEYSEKYSELKQKHDVLNTKYDELNYQYSYLQTSYVNLDYLYTINKELRIVNSLTSYYDYLRYEFGPMGSRSTWLNDEESCKFACQLALHDLHRVYWVKAEEYYGEDVGQNSYKQAWEVLRTAVNFCNIETSDSDTEKIEKILNNRILQYIIPRTFYLNIINLNFTITFSRKIPKMPFFIRFYYASVLVEGNESEIFEQPHTATVTGLNGIFVISRGQLLRLRPPMFGFVGTYENVEITPLKTGFNNNKNYNLEHTSSYIKIPSYFAYDILVYAI